MNNHQRDLESTIYLMLASIGYLNEQIIKISKHLKDNKEINTK